MEPFILKPGQGPCLAWLGMGTGWWNYMCDLDQTWIWSFIITIAPNASSTCHTSRPRLCVPDCRWHTITDCKLLSALLQNWTEHCSLPSLDGAPSKAQPWLSLEIFAGVNGPNGKFAFIEATVLFMLWWPLYRGLPEQEHLSLFSNLQLNVS